MSLRGADVDTTGPEASIEYGEGYFVLTASDEESGILRVEGEQTGNVIFEPDGCPAEFVSDPTDYPQGDTTLIVYNGVGLTTPVDIQINDGIPPQVLHKYKK